jgi:hypothetical protein
MWWRKSLKGLTKYWDIRVEEKRDAMNRFVTTTGTAGDGKAALTYRFGEGITPVTESQVSATPLAG